MRAVLALGLLGCALPLGADQEPIVGGNLDDGHDLAVVIVQLQTSTQGQGVLCTGTLITPRVVLLAAHCLVESPIVSSRIVFADSWDSSTGTYAGALVPMARNTTASWTDPLYSFSPTSGTMHDVGLLYVDGPPPAAVQPQPIYRQRLGGAAVGQSDRFVGFGLRSAASNSTLFERIYAVQTITQVTPMQVGWSGTSTMTCPGDSGGPHFLTLDGAEQIVAVTAFGDAGCAVASFAQRIDVSLAGILQFIADHDPQSTADCGADGVCGFGCADVDPDCPCAADGKCTTACSNPDLDPDCPLNCNADGFCQRSGCPSPDPDCGNGMLGDGCAKNDDCASSLCVPDGSSMVCTESCATGGSCPGGYQCATASNVCLPENGGGCHVGGGAGGGAWLVAALLWLRRRRHHVRDRRKLA